MGLCIVRAAQLTALLRTKKVDHQTCAMSAEVQEHETNLAGAQIEQSFSTR